jgi:two-component system, OmpR family, heavy metal sensor histidine kinase CusS
MRSLRSRLLLGMIAGMTVLLVLFSVVLYYVIRDALEEQFNRSLAASARLLAAGVELNISEEDEEDQGHQDEKNGVDMEFDIQMMPEFQRKKRPSYFQIWRQDGSVVVRSPSLKQNDLAKFKGPKFKPVFRSMRLRGDRPGRAVSLKFMPRIDDEDRDTISSSADEYMLTLVVARNASEMESNLRFLFRLLVTASLGIIILSCLFAAGIVRQGLKPLHALSSNISAIREDDLSKRIETTNLPTEILPIQERLNDLLARLEASFNRERRFTADVAHELRTPLAGIRTTLEVSLLRTRSESEYQSSLADTLAIAKSMETTVENLLALARLEDQQVTFRREPIRLAELVDACWKPFVEKAHKRNVTFDNQVSLEFTCICDPDYLSMVIANLLDNAVEYVDESGQIRLSGSQTAEQVEITVSNTGCTLTPEEVSQVFERFWQGDASRSQTGRHCGLGLALVEKIAQALGGDAVAEVVDEHTFQIRFGFATNPLNSRGN